MKDSRRFAIPGMVELDRDIHGLPEIRLRHASGALLRILEHGAHAVSWINGAGQERLFMSRASWFESGKPVRGGIPIVFPQFRDNGPLPKHGFARIMNWTLVDAGKTDAGHVFAALELRDSAATRAIWPHAFTTTLKFVLDAGLAIEWSVVNTGANAFHFNNGFHTYFLIQDIRKSCVSGLKGVAMVDSTQANARHTESADAIRIDRETDSVYVNAPDALTLHDESAKSEVRIYKQGMADVVVWNPWIEKAMCMEDYGAEEFERMICIETGNIETTVELLAGQAWKGVTRYKTADI